ncbi:hypothetical protein PIB30_066037 [Stylosanthes scabra]|uniref:Uncharacterized protein n=1 Tax=Stylosanthes scabra TaxID=79078 RepID=A0ABU6UKX9_9FABA|nr:hypothetical protein [Stylosanthes scabra]
MKKGSLQSKKRSLEANLRKSSTHMRGRGRICMQDDPSTPRHPRSSLGVAHLLHLTTHMCGKPPWPTSSRSSSRLDMLKCDPDSPTIFSLTHRCRRPMHRCRRPTHMRGKSTWPACIHAEPTPEPFSVDTLHHLTTHRRGKPTHMRGKPLSSRLSSRLDVLKRDLNTPACLKGPRICVEQQAYAWEAMKHLPSYSRPTYRR